MIELRRAFMRNDPSAWDDDVAKERGRLLAAHAIANNREQRLRVEDAFGLAYCMRRWPEAYQGGFTVIDKIPENKLTSEVQ